MSDAIVTGLVTAGVVAVVWILASLGIAACEEDLNRNDQAEIACIEQGGVYARGVCAWSKKGATP